MTIPDDDSNDNSKPTIIGWGSTSRHVTIRVPWSGRPVTVQMTAEGKFKAYQEELEARDQ